MCESQGYMEPQASGVDKAEDAVLRAIDFAAMDVYAERLPIGVASRFTDNLARIKAAHLASKPKPGDGDMQAAQSRIAGLEAQLAEERRVVKPVYIEARDFEALGDTFDIPAHHECPVCGMWVSRSDKSCSQGHTLDWTIVIPEAQP